MKLEVTKLETLFLKISVCVMTIPFLALIILGLPWLFNNPVNPKFAYMIYPIISGIYLSIIPFFFALFQAFRLLGYIDKNMAFSELSITALKNIRNSGLSISALYTVILPFVFLVAELDDAPGLVLVGMAFAGAPLVIAAFASVLQRLVKNTIEIKPN